MTRKFNKKNRADVGDIITDRSNPGKEYQVTGYNCELYVDAEGVFEDITYDAFCLESGDFMICFDEDITVVVKSDHSTEYIKSRYGRDMGAESEIESKIIGDIMAEFDAIYSAGKGGSSIANRTERPRELTKKEHIDRLLDEINDYQDLIRVFGDEDKQYGLAICEAKAKLKELTKGGR